MARKDAKLKADHFMAEPNKNNAFKAWNLGESGMLGALMPLLFPTITYNTKIFVPYLFKRLVKDNIHR
jgi:hormone-sensitive lipase